MPMGTCCPWAFAGRKQKYCKNLLAACGTVGGTEGGDAAVTTNCRDTDVKPVVATALLQSDSQGLFWESGV